MGDFMSPCSRTHLHNMEQEDSDCDSSDLVQVLFSKQQIDEIEQLLESIGSPNFSDTNVSSTAAEVAIKAAMTPSPKTQREERVQNSAISVKANSIDHNGQLWKNRINDVHTYMQQKNSEIERSIAARREFRAEKRRENASRSNKVEDNVLLKSYHVLSEPTECVIHGDSLLQFIDSRSY